MERSRALLTEWVPRRKARRRLPAMAAKSISETKVSNWSKTVWKVVATSLMLKLYTSLAAGFP